MKFWKKQERKNKAFIGLFVFVLGCLISLAFNSMLPEKNRRNESRDYTEYYKPVAEFILEGKGITTENGGVSNRYPPGFPIVLAGVYLIAEVTGIPEERAVFAFTILCAGGSSVLIFLIAGIFWEQKLAFLSAFLWMTYPFNLWLTKQPNSEVLFIVVLFAAFWMLLSHAMRESDSIPAYFAVGLLTGFAMLVRPIAIALPVLFSIFLIRWLRSFSLCKRSILVAVMIAGVLTPVMPWEGWNWLKTRKIIPLSYGGATSIRDGLTFKVDATIEGQGADASSDVEDFMARIVADRPNSNTVGKLWRRFLEEAADTPFVAAKMVFIKAGRALYGTDSQRYEKLIILVQIPYVILFVFAAAKAFLHGGQLRELTVLLLAVFLYFWAMSVVVLTILRYMVPAIGLLFLLVPVVLLKTGKNGPSGAQHADGAGRVQ